MSKKELLDEANGFMRDTECFRYIYGMLKLPESFEHKKFVDFDGLYNTSSRREVASYEAHQLVGEAYSSGVRTYEEAFSTCPQRIRLKYPLKK